MVPVDICFKKAQPTVYFHYLFNQGMGLKSLKKDQEFTGLLSTAFVVTVIITFAQDVWALESSGNSFDQTSLKCFL